MQYSKQVGSNVKRFRHEDPPTGKLDLCDSSKYSRKPYSGRNWVSVLERIPNESGDYLVLLRGANYRVMSFNLSNEKFIPICMNRAITHWMSLPSMPRTPP
jgi:hypothetical protein